MVPVIEALSCGSLVANTDLGEINKVVKSGLLGQVIYSSTDPTTLTMGLEKVLKYSRVSSCSQCLQTASKYRSDVTFDPLYDRIRVLDEMRFN